MQDDLFLTSPTTPPINKQNPKHQSNSRHHVLRYNSSDEEQASAVSKCFLVSIPSESLIHITTFVADPPSLFALSRVNRRLRDLIADDNTWYRAFAFHFLGIGPESEPKEENRLMLRRSESTWKKEYITRFNLTRRWERSRSATLNYQPHYWGVSSMHLLDNISLMTANLQYGIVTRSFPLTGKILKGYLDASGTTNGLGIGNPNEEFSPNVSCIALSSCGGTGRIAWGFRHGEVAMTSASRVMDSNRSAARYTKCRVEEEHAGELRYMKFVGRDDELLVSACAHGQVKLWDVKRMRCLWTGFGKREDAVLPMACVKVEINISAGVMVAALEGGDIMVWWGFRLQEDGNFLLDAIHELRVADDPPAENQIVDTLLLDPNSSPSHASILIHRANDRFFLRLVVDLVSGTVARTRFGDGPLGPLTSIKACFALHDRSSSTSLPTPSVPIDADTSSLAISLATDRRKPHESSFVLAGDPLGRVCIWNWDAEGSFSAAKAVDGALGVTAQVNSSRKWEAHDDGAISAIEVCGAVIVTGSTRGTLKVWDSLTLSSLRSFSSPASKAPVNGEWDPVGDIIIRDDLLVVSVGSRILVWQAGIVNADKKGKRKSTGKPKGRATGNLLNKWQQQIELNRDIRESQRLLEDERAHSQRVYGRERAQLSTLDQLGLDEREAIEYLLMLSREEDEQRRATGLGSSPPSSGSGEGNTGTVSRASDDDMDGVFSLDEQPGLVPIRPLAQDPTPPNSFRPPGTLVTPAITPSRSLPRFVPSRSNSKVQVSPPFLPEPTEAGLSTSPLRLAATLSGGTSPLLIGRRPSSTVSPPASWLSSSADAQHFPAMSASYGTPSRSVSSLQLAGSWTRGSPSSSVRSSSMSSAASVSPSPVAYGDRVSAGGAEEEDEELKYILELSLAEARSRGEA